MSNENQNTKPYAAAIASIRQQIKDNAEKGSAIRADISRLRAQPDTGPERNALWEAKRSIGNTTRHLLIAYGLLRGRSYANIESRSRTEPSGFEVRAIILRALGFEPHPWTSQYTTTERTVGQVPPAEFECDRIQKLFKRETAPAPEAVAAA